MLTLFLQTFFLPAGRRTHPAALTAQQGPER